MRAPRPALVALPVGLTGFVLAGTLLVAGGAPTGWTPVVDPDQRASVTDVTNRRDRPRGVPAVLVGPESYPRFTATGAPTSTVALAVTTTPARVDGELGIPQIVLEAYRTAAEISAERDPGCRLRWEVLAGIGKVESGHADDGLVHADGTTFRPILGPVLDGGAYAAIPDTDAGQLDGDRTWDRAVGPMQFLPGTWMAVGIDANDDGRVDPHNVFDAALAAARYLCVGSTDLGDRAALERALLRYNQSSEYVALVLAWADAYAAGQVTPLPPRPTPSTTPPTTTTSPTSPTSRPPTSPTTSPPTTDPTTPTSTGPVIGPPTTTSSSPTSSSPTSSSPTSTSSPPTGK